MITVQWNEEGKVGICTFRTVRVALMIVEMVFLVETCADRGGEGGLARTGNAGYCDQETLRGVAFLKTLYTESQFQIIFALEEPY